MKPKGIFPRLAWLALVCLCLGLIAGPSATSAAAGPPTYPLVEGKRLTVVLTGDPAAQHQVFVGFTATPGPAEQALVRGAGGKIKYTYWLVPAIAATLPEAAIEGLLRHPRVTHIEADIKAYAIDAELDNTWGVKRIGAGEVHERGNTGAGVKVAVIDTGIYYTHPDLEANYAGGYDFVNTDDDPMDDNGHGTHVAGTVAALRNGGGVVGARPGGRALRPQGFGQRRQRLVQ
jgi:subtilisin family serine protease